MISCLPDLFTRGLPVGKKTINAEEILTDIKAGVNNAALMEKYGLSEKGLQSLFKKLVDAGVLSQAELNIRRAILKKRGASTQTEGIQHRAQNHQDHF